ncbi:MAG: AsmA family protein, partial [Lentisphaeria bacterium]|nr:AsmA family protein [Lentisphaeria bacterium]
MEEEKKNPVAPENAAENAAESKGKKKGKKSLLRRILKWVLITLGTLLLIVIVALLCFRDFVIEHGVEQVGSLVVGTPINIGYIKTSLLDGTLHLKNFTVGNPTGYNNPHAFELAEIKVAVNTKSVFSDKIEVFEVLVSGVNVDYELKLGRSNLGEIQSNVEKATGANGDSSSPSPEKTEDDGGPEQEK